MRKRSLLNGEDLASPREGWALVIFRDDGSYFFASSGLGVGTPLWTKAQRKYAVQHKRALKAHGFKAKIVPVRWTPPVIIKGKNGGAR